MTTASVQANMESFEGVQARGAPIYILGLLAVDQGKGEGQWDSSWRTGLNVCVFRVRGQMIEKQ